MKQIYSKKYEQIVKKSSVDKQHDPNPWAVCHAALGKQKDQKFQRCVRSVKGQNGKQMDSEQQKCMQCGGSSAMMTPAMYKKHKQLMQQFSAPKKK